MPRLEAPSPAVAASFLTCLPLGGRAADGPASVARAAPLFPLVGAAVGALVGGAAIGFAEVLPAVAAGLLAVAVELILTGALHADGLADSADGLGGREPERALAIMRDHALGTYGAAALFLDLALKATALATLAEAEALGAIVAAFALSRAAPLPLSRLLASARRGEGAGALLAGRIGTGAALLGIGLAAGAAMVLAGGEGLALIACAAAATAGVGLLARRRLDGITGDAMGAAVELSATASLLTAAGLLP